MTAPVFILLAATVANFSLAGLVYAKHTEQKAQRDIQQIFAITALCVAGWTLTNALFQMTDSVAGATLWAALSYLSALGLAASFLHFAWLFPVRSAIPQTTKVVLWLTTLCLSVLALLPGWIITGVELIGNRRILTTAGLYLIALFLFAALGGALWVLWRHYSTSRGTARNQLRFVLTGATLTAICGLTTNLALPLLGHYHYVWLGPASSLFFVSFSVYAIVTQRLFDIRLLIQRTLVYTLLLGSFIAAYSSLVLLLTGLVQRLGISGFSPFIANLIGALGIGFGVEPLRKGLERVTDGFLFRREHEEALVLSDLTLALNAVVALDEVLDAVLQSLEKSFRLERAAAYVFAREGQDASLKRLRQVGYASPTKLLAGAQDGLVKYFEGHLHPLRIEELARTEPEVDGQQDEEAKLKAKAGHKLQALHIAVALPLHQNGHLTGLLLLGSRRSDEPYSSDDIALLERIGAQALSAMQKAAYYEGDQQKSEFVSIASHELLTPITAIEGYASMILDEGMGQVDEQARNYLSKMATSAHRLSTLVRDLLSVSRIEAGRVQIKPRSVAIEKLMADTVDQLRFLAEDKQLRLVYEKPAQPLPPVWADPDRVMQVLVNLVSNGIKYTPQGCVTLTAKVLSGTPSQIEITVADTGLGMTEEAQSHLFEKFYRVATPETSAIQGTGLGLYITKALIEKMNGRLHLESTEGKGSSFHFTLPVLPDQPQTTAE